MKKLNRSELEVIAKRIQKELRDKAIAIQKEMDERADLANVALAKRVVKQLKSLLPETLKAARYDSDLLRKPETITVENVLLSMRKTQTVIETHYGVQCEIMDALIIGQINSPDVESLANAVVAQFVKNP